MFVIGIYSDCMHSRVAAASVRWRLQLSLCIVVGLQNHSLVTWAGAREGLPLHGLQSYMLSRFTDFPEVQHSDLGWLVGHSCLLQVLFSDFNLIIVVGQC